MSPVPGEAAAGSPRVWILTACRNEERILPTFLAELQDVVAASGIAGRTVLHVVDDLSFDGSREVLQSWAARATGYELVVHEVPTNLGNQGAMCLGLQRLELGPEDLLLTLDCDGEDDLGELPSVLRLAAENPGKVVFIERGRRAEHALVRLLFGAYKGLFRFLTERRVVPNNFMVVPGAVVPAFKAAPLAAVHLAYALYKLNPPHVTAVRDRRRRYGGQTSQNLYMLVTHGLVGLMLFYEVVVAKLFVLLALSAVVGGSLAALGFLLPAGGAASRLALAASFGLGGVAAALASLLVAASLALFFKLTVYRATLAAAELPPTSPGR